MCRVSKPNATDVAEVLVHAVYRLPQAGARSEPAGAASTLNLGDFYAIFTDLRIEGGWRPIGGGGDADLRIKLVPEVVKRYT